LQSGRIVPMLPAMKTIATIINMIINIVAGIVRALVAKLMDT
jgi:hypothetical protein